MNDGCVVSIKVEGCVYAVCVCVCIFVFVIIYVYVHACYILLRAMHIRTTVSESKLAVDTLVEVSPVSGATYN